MNCLRNRRPHRFSTPVWLALLVTASCGPGRPVGGADAAIRLTDAEVTDTEVTDAPTSVGEANIAEALNCARPAGVSGMRVPGAMQLHTLDPAEFPNALCNDGTPAVLYFRPYRGEANRDRWVLALRGGGSCGNGPNCAARWCGCDDSNCPASDYSSSFDANNMSGGGSRSRDGSGIMLRDSSNPLADYNQVQFIYCSSDEWAGGARNVAYTVTHPVTGAEVSYTMHFLGRSILSADLDTLRHEAAAPLSYTYGTGAAVVMPDLDEASEVVVVGDSGGGAGVINNLDAIADLLHDHHVGGAGPEVIGVIDAIVGPDLESLNWDHNNTPLASYAEAFAAAALAPSNVGAFRDTSCAAMHPDSDGRCLDGSHVVRNHIRTPFFVRMALFDQLISSSYGGLGLEDAEFGPLVSSPTALPAAFAQTLARELADLTADAEEPPVIAPGVFAPACIRHDTIHRDDEVYGVSIVSPGLGPQYFFDAFTHWREGTLPSVVITSDPSRADTVCAP